MDHYQEYFSTHPPPFGKYQRCMAIIIFMGFQAMLYFFSLLVLYSVFTLQFDLIIVLFSVSLIQNLASRSQWFVDFINDFLQIRRYSKDYQLIFQEEIKENNKCLFGMHPHGVLSTGALANLNLRSGPFTNIVGMSSRMALLCPFVGFFLKLWGVESVDGHHMKKLMEKGKNILLLPGGFEEATLTNPKELRLYIKNRKGFVKYAIEHNYSIYPMMYLNEHQAFWTFDYLKGLRLFLNKFKLPGVFFWNLKTGIFMPPEMEYWTIVGKKINYRILQPGEAITQAEIDEVHHEYIEELKRIYEKYKYLNGGVPMKIY